MTCGGSSRSGWIQIFTNFPVWLPGVSVAGSSGLDCTCVGGVTLVGYVILGLSFLIYKTKGVLTFSDPLEALGGKSKLMFGKAHVTLRAKTLSKYKVSYRNCLLSH